MQSNVKQIIINTVNICKIYMNNVGFDMSFVRKSVIEKRFILRLDLASWYTLLMSETHNACDLPIIDFSIGLGATVTTVWDKAKRIIEEFSDYSVVREPVNLFG